MPIPTRAYAIGAAAVVGLGLAATLTATLMQPTDRFAECRTSRVAGGAAIGGPFTLVDETGATVTETDVITGPSLVYFGYTFCPDVCPLDSARNAEAVDILEQRGYTVTPIFISIDPERDTPEVVAEFTDVMHPRMIGLTGTPEQVKAASQAYRTYFKKQDGDPEYYLVDHSTQTYLVFPEIGFVEFFGRETMPDQMADTVACFIDAAG
ncbi:MAG: SCO family protein [Rhodobacteraceae bacterium]|nr:SCO family protein [Paracoccaceae bacterium]